MSLPSPFSFSVQLHRKKRSSLFPSTRMREQYPFSSKRGRSSVFVFIAAHGLPPSFLLWVNHITQCVFTPFWRLERFLFLCGQVPTFNLGGSPLPPFFLFLLPPTLRALDFQKEKNFFLCFPRSTQHPPFPPFSLLFSLKLKRMIHFFSPPATESEHVPFFHFRGHFTLFQKVF